MKVVGRRVEPAVRRETSAAHLIDAALLGEALAHLAPLGLMRKGVYRFKTHAQANQHQGHCLAERMAALARQRGR